MEEQEINEVDYIRGYNNGWLISQYEPELAKDLRANIQLDSDLASGLFHGIRDYDLEQENKRTTELNEIRETSLSRDQEPAKDDEIKNLNDPKDIEIERLNELENLRGDDELEIDNEP